MGWAMREGNMLHCQPEKCHHTWLPGQHRHSTTDLGCASQEEQRGQILEAKRWSSDAKDLSSLLH